MIRVLLTIVLPLLLPTLLYVLWVLTMRRAELNAGGQLLQKVPLVWLAAAGLALVALVLVVASLGFGGSGNGVYVPPTTVDGKIVPGHVVPAQPR
ncbi:MAG TPA: DUF6111 family protein [Stellaceae bacterium]|nr:DUF6111 family protein [Stellaceae bacterium]